MITATSIQSDAELAAADEPDVARVRGEGLRLAWSRDAARHRRA